MKISEVITRLEELKKQHGDIRVSTRCADYWWLVDTFIFHAGVYIDQVGDIQEDDTYAYSDDVIEIL